MTITMLASVGVMLVVLVAGAVWLALPLRDTDIPAEIDHGRDDPDAGSHRRYDDDVLSSMRRHPSAAGMPWYTPAGATPPASPSLQADSGFHGPNLHARARVVFASVQDGHLVLDCVLSEGDDPDPHVRPGLPITLSLGALETPWLAVHVEAMLERWADGERLIDLELLDSPIGGRATLVSASSRLVLPLTTVAGLD